MNDEGKMPEDFESETFTTSRGVTVKFRSIATLLDKLDSAHKIPDPPTYEFKSVTGATIKGVHNATTLDVEGNPEQTAANHAAWDAYEKARDEALRQHNLAMTRLILLRGVEVEMPKDDAWAKEQAELFGIPVPTDPHERRMHWLETEAVTTAQDMETIVLGVLNHSGVSEELLRQMADSFRYSLRRDSARPVGNSQGQVDDDHAVRRSGGRVQAGQVSQRVGRRHHRR